MFATITTLPSRRDKGPTSDTCPNVCPRAWAQYLLLKTASIPTAEITQDTAQHTAQHSTAQTEN